RALAVQQLYQKYLHRSADPAGLASGVIALTTGTIAQLKATLLGSPEYFQTRGNSTNAGFLQAIYPDLLGRAPDAQGEASLSQLLAQGTSRTAVATMMINSLEAHQVLVTGYYQEFLGRQPDTAGLNSLVTQLQNGARDEDIIAAITSSGEY